MKSPRSSKGQVGVVLKKKMAKTAVVRIERLVRVPLYEKRSIRTKKVYAHDEHDTAQPGDTVLIRGVRPLSKLKRWRIVRVLQRSTVAVAV
ncbi:MAG: 30S ribosomal protein S17 [bacterium]|nr:30S ribosomal protein S17 [bacterium]